MSSTALSAPIHQRACGRAEVLLNPAPGGACLAHLFQAAPLRVLFPDVDPGEPTLGALVNVAGGLAGGDQLDVSLGLARGARFTATTPAAEKVYRSLGEETRIASRLTLAEEGVCEWLPQETILFDGARLDRRLDFTLAPGARLLAAEMLVLGRAARGERLTRGRVLDRWQVRRAGALIWTDALRLADPPAALGARFALGGAGALATLMLAGPDAAGAREMARELAGGGASLVAPDLLVARWVGEAGTVRRAVSEAVSALRASVFGHPAHPPRLWRI
jgi:urease accessory protein